MFDAIVKKKKHKRLRGIVRKFGAGRKKPTSPCFSFLTGKSSSSSYNLGVDALAVVFVDLLAGSLGAAGRAGETLATALAIEGDRTTVVVVAVGTTVVVAVGTTVVAAVGTTVVVAVGTTVVEIGRAHV